MPKSLNSFQRNGSSNTVTLMCPELYFSSIHIYSICSSLVTILPDKEHRVYELRCSSLEVTEIPTQSAWKGQGIYNFQR